MDDQFGGRTDDDLFADEFEPVAGEPEPPVQATQHAPFDVSSQVQPDTHTQSQPQVPVAAPAPQQPTSTSKPLSSAPSSAPSAPKGLRQSRHAHGNGKPAPSPRPPRQQQQPPTAKTSTPAATSTEPAASRDTTGSASATASTSDEAITADDKDDAAAAAAAQATPPTAAAPSAGNAVAVPRNGEKPDREARLRSGANPRTKLTDEELAAKMEQMRILSAEKTRRFEQARRDESEHAAAYARGMEEARKRRAVEDEKRRRGEEERRRMDDERAKNRERKLAALGQKEGGWDLGRDHEEETAEERRGFRSAHGGVRGARSGTGLAGSRFAHADDNQVDGGRRDSAVGDRGGRGRGRGRGGRGRGGLFDDRAGEERRQGNGYHGTSRAPPAQKPPAVDDEFPALPSAGAKKADAPAKAPLPSLDALVPLSPQVGGWDDEMAAMDAKAKQDA